MFHDSSGPRRLKPMLDELRRADLGQEQGRAGDRPLRARARRRVAPHRAHRARLGAEQQLPHVYDSQGICHVVVPRARPSSGPGMFCVGGDSHSPTGGAFGAYMFGIGATEMLGVVVTGEIWLEVPQTILMQWDGRLAAGVERQGHDARDARPLRHERRALPGGGVRRRRGACAVDARAHDAGQHERRTRRAGRPDRTRRHHARLAGRARRAVDDATSRPGTATTAPTGERARVRRFDAGAAGGRAAQPGQRARRERLDRHARRTWPTSAPAPAPSSTTCAPPRGCCAAARSHRGVQLLVAPASAARARDAERGGRAGGPARCRRNGAAQRLRRLRRLRRRDSRRQHGDLVDGAQLQGPHGLGPDGAGVSGLAGFRYAGRRTPVAACSALGRRPCRRRAELARRAR